MNVNTLIYAGRLTRDPETQNTKTGLAICNLTVASNRTFSKDSEKKEEVTFLDCKAFGKTAETIAQHFRKGMEIFIEGRITQESWDDKATGQKRSKIVCTINNFQFVGKSDGEQAPPSSASKNVGGEPEARRAAPAPKPEEEDPDSDVPFRAFLPAWLGWLVPSFAR